MQKKITHILNGREKAIAPGQIVLQPLPHAEFRFANPFIVLHHMPPQTVKPGSQIRLPMHPHRGFSPELRSCHWQELVRNLRSSVAFQLQGEGFHLDNAGNEGITPQLLEHGGVHLRLASGHYEDATGPLKSFTPVILISGELDAGHRVQLTAIPGYWTLLYVINGSVCVNSETITQHQLIVFEKENDELIVTAVENTRLLFLSAQPIDEPVAAKDNFVMNTQQEIDQAIADYKAGRF